MAEKRTINIDINNNADETEKDFKNLNETLDDTAKANDEVNKSFDKGATFAQRYGEELEPLTTRMGEAEDRLYELALAGDTTSKEYQELLASVGNYRKVQIQTDLAVDQAATTMSEKLGGALTGAASGFAAVQGVMAITGSESEALEESLLKVQGALAFQQGVQGVLEYTKSVGLASKATAIWNAILALNPITLLIASITTVIALIATFTIGIDGIVQGFKNLTDWIGISSFAEMDAAKERRKNFKEAQKQREAERLELIELQKEREIYNKRLLDYDNAEIERLEVLGKSTFKKRKALLEEQKLTAEQNGKFTESIRIQTKIIALEKERNEKAIAYANKRLEIARQIQDLELEILEDGVEKEVEISNVKFNRLLEDLKTNTELTAKERKRLNELYLFQQQEAENDIRNQFRQDQLNEEKEFQVVRLDEVVNEAGQMRLDALKKQADEEVDIEKNKNAEIEALDGATQEQKIAAVKNTLSTIANLAELFAGESEREQKKAFKIQKAANIAQATIDTYASAVSSYNSLSGIPVVGPVLGGAAAAAAVTAGLLNIKSIAQQEFGGGVGDTPAVPSDVGGGGAPQFNVVGDSGVNQLASLQSQPTQAYVVSGEVTTAQALDRNRVQNATL